MKGTGNGQRHGHPGLEVLGDGLDLLTSLDASRYGIIAVAQVVGYLDTLIGTNLGSRSLAELCDLVGRQADDGHHTRLDHVGGRLHALPAELDQPEPVLEAHRASVRERGILPERKTSGHVRSVDGVVASLRPKLLKGCHAGHKDGRLTDGRAVQLLGRSLGAYLQK